MALATLVAAGRRRWHTGRMPGSGNPLPASGRRCWRPAIRWFLVAALVVGAASTATAQRAARQAIDFPPVLPNGQTIVVDQSPAMLQRPATLREEVLVAQVPPVIEFGFYPGQEYPGNPWSNWGDGTVYRGKYYSAIGDHLGPSGNAYVYEYDGERVSQGANPFRKLVDLKHLLQLPEGHYVPGKIHGRLDIGSDGWLYFATHRGSPRFTTDAYHYRGDWIIRCNPASGAAEVVAHAPVPKHCIPCSVLDRQRLIFYGGTAAGTGNEVDFFAYDIRAGRLLCHVSDGPARYMIWAASTGRVYYTAKQTDEPLMRYDPQLAAPPQPLPVEIGIRAATSETPQGVVYTVSDGQRSRESILFAFDVQREQARALGPAAVGQQQYIASIDADPSGRYLYYVPGAHGGSHLDGTPIVQFDVKTGKKKVLAFLHPYYQQKYGFTLVGTYSTAVDERGEKLYITWNISRGSRAWDCCGLSVVHIPEEERPQ